MLAVGALAVLAPSGPRRGWLVGGFLYMTLAMGALLVFRNREPEGVLLILWLVLVVVAADVGAYFVGRRVGGRRLWPAVSPGKTWSGALGGLAAAGLVGVSSRGWWWAGIRARIGGLSLGDRGLLAVRRPAGVARSSDASGSRTRAG